MATVVREPAPAAPVDNQSAAPPSRPLRLWPAVAMLVPFWAYEFANQLLEMDMGSRFLSRLATHALLLLGFLVWGLFFSRGLSWRDRLLPLAVFLVASAAVLAIADRTVNGFSIFLDSDSRAC